MKNITFLTFILLTTKSFGQAPLNFTECKADPFFVSADQKPAWADSTMTLKDYFFNYFKDQNFLGKSSGKIMLGILISESGQPCCRSFSDIGKTGIDPQEFKNAINKMPLWKPAKQTNSSVAFLYQTILEIKKGQIVK